MKTQTESPDAFPALVELLDAALAYRDRLSSDRRDAQELYDGEVKKWLPVDVVGRSKVVSHDVSATIGKVLPSLSRTILGNEIIAEYQAQAEEDVGGAEQSTDYINLVVLDECRARKAIYSSMMDAAKIRNGVLHVCAEKRIEVRGSSHTSLTDEGLAALVQDEGVEVLEHQERDGGLDDMGQPVALHDVKIRRTTSSVTPKLIAVPMEEYLIHPDATNSHEDAVLVGREYLAKRSDLVAMMPEEAERINALSTATMDPTQEGERMGRRKTGTTGDTPGAHELQPIQVFDLYVRLDFDGDGIAELRHILLCGGRDEENVFENEYADFVPYYDMVLEAAPHQWEGVSITDHVGNIMLAKTALLRGAQDNLYLVNDPQPVVNALRLKNPDALLEREPGRPLFVDGTDKVSDVVTYNLTPYVADKALQGIAYWDKQIVERTGIDDASAGLPPDALQNVTAKASALLEQKGIARVEMMVRTVAECLKPVFAGLLRLVIQHTDRERMVRLRNNYVPVDPRSWNAEMDVRINTGLGAGTRERDMMVMQNIMAMQERLVQHFGEDNPFVKPENLYKALEKSVQAAGIQAVGAFFSKPDEAEIERLRKARAAAKPPEVQVVEAKAAASVQEIQARMPFEMQMKQMDVEAAREKEIVQSQAAVEERKAIAAIESGAKSEELALKKYEIDTKAQIERERMQQDIAREHAKSFGDSVTKLNDNATAPAQDAGPQLLEVIAGLRTAFDDVKEAVMMQGRPKRFVRNAQGDIEGFDYADAPSGEAVN